MGDSTASPFRLRKLNAARQQKKSLVARSHLHENGASTKQFDRHFDDGDIRVTDETFAEDVIRISREPQSRIDHTGKDHEILDERKPSDDGSLDKSDQISTDDSLTRQYTVDSFIAQKERGLSSSRSANTSPRMRSPVVVNSKSILNGRLLEGKSSDTSLRSTTFDPDPEVYARPNYRNSSWELRSPCDDESRYSENSSSKMPGIKRLDRRARDTSLSPKDGPPHLARPGIRIFERASIASRTPFRHAIAKSRMSASTDTPSLSRYWIADPGRLGATESFRGVKTEDAVVNSTEDRLVQATSTSVEKDISVNELAFDREENGHFQYNFGQAAETERPVVPSELKPSEHALPLIESEGLRDANVREVAAQEEKQQACIGSTTHGSSAAQALVAQVDGTCLRSTDGHNISVLTEDSHHSDRVFGNQSLAEHLSAQTFTKDADINLWPSILTRDSPAGSSASLRASNEQTLSTSIVNSMDCPDIGADKCGGSIERMNPHVPDLNFDVATGPFPARGCSRSNKAHEITESNFEERESGIELALRHEERSPESADPLQTLFKDLKPDAVLLSSVTRDINSQQTLFTSVGESSSFVGGLSFDSSVAQEASGSAVVASSELVKSTESQSSGSSLRASSLAVGSWDKSGVSCVIAPNSISSTQLQALSPPVILLPEQSGFSSCPVPSISEKESSTKIAIIATKFRDTAAKAKALYDLAKDMVAKNISPAETRRILAQTASELVKIPIELPENDYARGDNIEPILDECSSGKKKKKGYREKAINHFETDGENGSSEISNDILFSPPSVVQGGSDEPIRYNSYRSGSFERHFSVMPNFYVQDSSISSAKQLVRRCRDQISLVAAKETTYVVSTNRKTIVNARLEFSRTKLFEGVSINVFTRQFVGSSKQDYQLSQRRMHSSSRLSLEVVSEEFTRDDDELKARFGNAVAGSKKRFHRQISKSDGKQSVSIDVINVCVPEAIIGRILRLPCYSAYIPLRKSVICEDDPILRYVSYFGDNDNDDIMADVYAQDDVQTQGLNVEQDRLADLYEQDDVIIEQFIIHFLSLNRSLDDLELKDLEIAISRSGIPISGGARGEKDKSEKDAGESFSARCVRLLESLRKRAKLEMLPEFTRKVNSERMLMDSFRSLFCRLCFVYDCEVHGGPELHDTFDSTLWDVQRAWAAASSRSSQAVADHDDLCGVRCYKISENGSRSVSKKARVAASLSDEDLEDGRRWLCAKAIVICSGSFCDAARLLNNYSCAEVYDLGHDLVTLDQDKHQTASANSLTDDEVLVKQNLEATLQNMSSCLLDTLATSKLRYKLHTNKEFRQSLKQVVLSGTSKRLIQEKKEGLLNSDAHTPCAHFGPCSQTNGCTCVATGSFCTKHCMCIIYPSRLGGSGTTSICKNFFPGCTCQSSCDKSCPCLRAARACDPDLCRNCVPRFCSSNKESETRESFSAQVAAFKDTSSQQDADVDEDDEDIDLKDFDLNMNVLPAGRSPSPTPCANVAEEKLACRNQLGGLVHLLVAPSGVPGAGWGIFARFPIPQGAKVSEYLGEIISQEEAERRGRFYDKVNRSYLFNVNADQVVDAYRKGNKIKFCNHDKRPNCDVKVAIVGRQQHIILYAKTKIEAGEELFFDYHYEQELKSAFLKKHGTVVEWMRNPKGKSKKRNLELTAAAAVEVSSRAEVNSRSAPAIQRPTNPKLKGEVDAPESIGSAGLARSSDMQTARAAMQDFANASEVKRKLQNLSKSMEKVKAGMSKNA